MVSSELRESWQKTTTLLREARAELSETAERICADELARFEESLDHNELELALDRLEAAVRKSHSATLSVLEPLLAAAENMQLQQHAARYRTQIDRIRRDAL